MEVTEVVFGDLDDRDRLGDRVDRYLSLPNLEVWRRNPDLYWNPTLSLNVQNYHWGFGKMTRSHCFGFLNRRATSCNKNIKIR